MAKRRDSIYQPGERPGTWVKHKIHASDDFVVGGFLPGANGFEELLVGRWDADRLMFVESVRNGFVPWTKELVLESIRKLAIKTCPFANLPERSGKMNAGKMSQARWVKPKVVVEIAFNNWTEGGHLRHAKFLRLRLDKGG